MINLVGFPHTFFAPITFSFLRFILSQNVFRCENTFCFEFGSAPSMFNNQNLFSVFSSPFFTCGRYSIFVKSPVSPCSFLHLIGVFFAPFLAFFVDCFFVFLCISLLIFLSLLRVCALPLFNTETMTGVTFCTQFFVASSAEVRQVIFKPLLTFGAALNWNRFVDHDAFLSSYSMKLSASAGIRRWFGLQSLADNWNYTPQRKELPLDRSIG